MFSSLNEKFIHNDQDFPCFTLLPWELRNDIWKKALQGSRRLIRVSLLQDHVDAGSDHFTQAQVDKDKTGMCVHIANNSIISPLFQVSIEARQAALEFYRVRIPCYMIRGSRRNSRFWRQRFGVFVFNPEHDIISLRPRASLHRCNMFSAIRDLDPRRVGIQNIAIFLKDLEFSPQLDPPETSDFVQNFANFREFYFLNGTTSYYINNAKDRYNDGRYGTVPSSSKNSSGHRKPLQQRFTPLSPGCSVSFDLLRCDPRPIEDDMFRLFMGFLSIDSSIARCKALIEEGWGVGHTLVNYQLLFLYSDRNPCWSNDGDVEDLSSSEDEENPSVQVTAPEDQDKEVGENIAHGFWLFPIDAFTESTRLEHPTRSMDVWDLSEYPPELALARMS